MTTDTIRHLGAEFHRAADSLADTLARLDMARTARLAFLRECSKDSTARLAALKEEIRTLPEQIAKWDAEAARLESQTAEDLLRQALEPVHEKPKPEPYRAGLPPERLRKVWAEWDVTPTDDVVTFRDGEYNFASWGNGEGPLWWPLADTKDWSKYSLRPHGATWARVEAMADEAERAAEHVTVAAFDPSRHEGGPDGVLCLHFAWIPPEFFAHHTTWETPSGKQMRSADVLAIAALEWRPVGATWAEVKATVMQPTVKPAEDEDPIEKAFWRYCMLIDKTQKTARVRAGYLEAPYPNRDAFKIAVRATVFGLGVPATSFTPRRVAIASDEVVETYAIPALVPARVVEEPK
jgi:hypothetical protein